MRNVQPSRRRVTNIAAGRGLRVVVEAVVVEGGCTHTGTVPDPSGAGKFLRSLAGRTFVPIYVTLAESEPRIGSPRPGGTLDRRDRDVRPRRATGANSYRRSDRNTCPRTDRRDQWN